MPFSEHPEEGDFTVFGPLSVTFEGGIINSVDIYFTFCEAQARVRQGSARDGP